MRVIDLLNKIAKGEEIPKKIKYNNEIYHIDELENFYISDDRKALLEYIFDYLNDYDALRSEVEIIEEDKEIEELDIKKIYECDDYQYIHINFKNTWNKINELIDEVNKLKRSDE